MAGVPLKAVAELPGHSETRITERYAHLSPPDLQSYVDLLERDEPKIGASPVQARDKAL